MYLYKTSILFFQELTINESKQQCVALNIKILFIIITYYYYLQNLPKHKETTINVCYRYYTIKSFIKILHFSYNN